MPSGFLSYALDVDVSAEFVTEAYALRLQTWNGRRDLSARDCAVTHFGFVFDGPCGLETPHGGFPVPEGGYFAVPGNATLSGGRGMVVSQFGHHGFLHVGGPIEETGRLRYIDGCSDSLLVPPVVRGDPCLNLLCIPPGTSQTAHTHPSHRLGVVVSGRGTCRTPEADVPLEAGLAWVIAPDAVHAFHTEAEALRIVAFHPDSDFGPTHECHPMLNRTLVDGVSVPDRRKEAADDDRQDERTPGANLP